MITKFIGLMGRTYLKSYMCVMQAQSNMLILTTPRCDVAKNNISSRPEKKNLARGRGMGDLVLYSWWRSLNYAPLAARV